MIGHAPHLVLQRAGPRRLELEPIAAIARCVDVAGREWREQRRLPVEMADTVLRPAVLGIALNGHDELRAEHSPHLTLDSHVARLEAVQRDFDLERDAVRERDLRGGAAEQLQRDAGPRRADLLLPTPELTR